MVVEFNHLLPTMPELGMGLPNDYADELAFLTAERDYDQIVRQYRDALVRHRLAMLRLNTAVGSRIMP